MRVKGWILEISRSLPAKPPRHAAAPSQVNSSHDSGPLPAAEAATSAGAQEPAARNEPAKGAAPNCAAAVAAPRAPPGPAPAAAACPTTYCGAPKPENDAERVAHLRSLGILDTVRPRAPLPLPDRSCSAARWAACGSAAKPSSLPSPPRRSAHKRTPPLASTGSRGVLRPHHSALLHGIQGERQPFCMMFVTPGGTASTAPAIERQPLALLRTGVRGGC